MDNEDKALLIDSLDGIVRDQRDRLDEALTEFGWRDLLAEAQEEAVSILLRLTGKHLAPLQNLDAVALNAAGMVDDATAVVYPPLGSPAPTSLIRRETASPTAVVRGVVFARSEPPARIMVPANTGNRVVFAALPWDGPWPDTGGGIDPSAGLAPLEASMPADALRITEGNGGTDQWHRLRAAVHRGLADHLVGVGSRMLELATNHVMSRTQFGRSLASFQAVKHRLADVRLWQEGARLAAEAAWEEDTDSARTAAAILAKSTANRFTRLAREHCQQVLGGMGFTWEHDFHRFVRRALLVEPLLGATSELHEMLGNSLRAEDGAPRLAAL
ncbi:Acyl-CoA dehydrogenase, C-terminal domain [Haloechinothrix alba]|uniref:Acyl-CoA dehydrogenase, C-terminal domain n=1 Tax=Haloechinothrix alba TaxID=664784 RepID=A0A239AF61_9PSEU|nr:acyl-CoA dehydrogenase family protein [Haloechinothrix alba]SNR94297.1 Acyl-CoA dehydrogenase, C-terminal domain [Haloechinothrix alba]